MALVLLGFVAYCFITAFAWGAAMPPLVALAFFCLWLSAILGRLGNLASYHRWRDDRLSELLHLGSGPLSGGFLALLLAHIVRMGLQTGQWGLFWWTVCVLALSIVVAVAGHFYGQDEGPRPENSPPAGRNPSD